MKTIPSPQLEEGRIREGEMASLPNNMFGAFFVTGPKGQPLAIISSGHDEESGWEHVSVSCSHRIPNWLEMCFVKDLFWNDDETVVQYHPRKEDYVNYHPYVLHMWRWIDGEIPTPPSQLVGPK